jgi:hypothetical protein
MKNSKAEVIDVEIKDNGDMRVKLVDIEDRDLFIATMRSICASTTIFQILSDTEVLCKLN